MPGVHKHVPQILWIEKEENCDGGLCQGWVWVQPKVAQDFILSNALKINWF